MIARHRHAIARTIRQIAAAGVLLVLSAGVPATPAARQFNTPQAMVSGLRAAGQSAGQIAAQLNKAFNQDARQVAGLLKAAGFTPPQVASALKDTFKIGGEAVAVAMESADFTIGQIAALLRSDFNATGAQLGQWLKAAGYNAQQVVAAMKSASAQAFEVLAALRSGFGHETCGVAGCPAATLMRQAGYTAAQIGSALRQSYSLSAAALAGVFDSVYGLSGGALEAALQAAGFTAAQIAAATNAAVTATTTAGANAIDVAAIVHGTHQNCYFPSGQVFGLGGGTPPLPLPASGSPFTVSFVGQNLLLATDIQGWPAGATATIRQRTNCYLTVELRLPPGSRQGTQGQGTLRVGRAAGPRFAWTIGPIPPRISAGPPQVIGAGGGGAVAGGRNTPVGRPDLVATLTGTVFRFTQANSRRVNDQFCQTLPTPPAGQVSIGEVTVGGVTWGVINSSNASVNTAFQIELRNNGTQQVIQATTVPPGTLRPGTQTFQTPYNRPQNRTRVVKVTPTTSAALRNTYGGGSTGCFQAPMPANDPMNWQDPSFRVRVDTANTVDEGTGGEINNTGVY